MALISGVSVHKTPLRRPGASATSTLPPSPWCYSADAFSVSDFDDRQCESSSSSSSDTSGRHAPAVSPNFLATQVWPSARSAAVTIERYSDPAWSICEFGCGPALPSIVAATTRSKGARVIATDYEEFALQLVDAAATEQGLDSIISTQIHDLTSDDDALPEADCYVLSDVFECAAVAYGAARQTVRALNLGKRVWVFAQSDRAQREVYKKHINKLLQLDNVYRPEMDREVQWQSDVSGIDMRQERLVLFDVDETKVEYC
eukprot:CAMPEP_0178517938 /NCGR_PEP_ID=MMETSP0696-20121128/25972_1 /TAXON_ID=265572 /ORGANISM="Extubocellulus spinifer, Strain CCMP396" /LENGTH=259 /DNA_ID=CAMNT_0020148431 /DNA_START=68 /DNA_END=847 /DNA_ORIENTATION=-